MKRGLPWMGLGLGSNSSVEDVPQPYALLDAEPGLFDFVEYSAPLSFERARAEASLFETMLARRDGVPLLFHPVHLNLFGPELEAGDRLDALSAHLEAVGSPWVSNDVGWWHRAEEPFPGYLYLPPPLDAAGLESCVAHALALQERLPVPLILENPALIALRGPMHVLDFMAELHRRTELGLLLDLGHLFSHQLARGLALTDGLDRFPLDRVFELHIAGGVVTRRGARAAYVDDHTQPVREELFTLLEWLLPRCTNLRAVTFEGDGHPPEVAARTLRRLRPWIRRPDAGPAARPSGGVRPGPELGSRPSAPAPDPAVAWSVFELAYGGRRGEDEEGERAEQDFRLAALAERVDVSWPLTRLLLAPDRAGLAAFAASPELRALFEEGGKDLEAAFAAYARRRLREAPDEAIASVLSLESWARAAAPRRERRASVHAEVALAPGVGLGSFPVNLGELLFAARALRRHLGARALASERLEASGFEALSQVARRALPGPWRVVLRRRGARVEISEPSPELWDVLRRAAEGASLEQLRAAGLEPPLRRAVQRGWIQVGDEASLRPPTRSGS